MAGKNNVLRCPKCGGSDIKLSERGGKLKCANCRASIESILANKAGSIDILNERIVDEGAKKIIDEKTMLTMKCSSCGARTTLNTEEATSARCPWCRHILSVMDKQPNGAVPDLILPFKISKKDAEAEISKFIEKHKRFSKRAFVKEFNTENVMGVYLPYLVIDMNVHATMIGDGEVEVRQYTVGSGDDRETLYDADVYKVVRDFDLIVDDLTIEASQDKLQRNARANTNNIINAIMPFDTENAVAWDPRYVRGFSCERRDIDVEDIDCQVKNQTEDIMRYRMHDSIAKFDRGVRWDTMRLQQKGVKFRTAYMPVWLYSYMDTWGKNESKIYYIAVNARTGETVGSAPVAIEGLIATFAAMPLFGFLGSAICSVLTSFLETMLSSAILARRIMLIPAILTTSAKPLSLIWMVAWGIVIAVTMKKSVNKSARHMHETDTRAEIKNLKEFDGFSESLLGLSRWQMLDRNDNVMKGTGKNESINMSRERKSVNGNIETKRDSATVLLCIILCVVVPMFIMPLLYILVPASLIEVFELIYNAF